MEAFFFSLSENLILQTRTVNNKQTHKKSPCIRKNTRYYTKPKQQQMEAFFIFIPKINIINNKVTINKRKSCAVKQPNKQEIGFFLSLSKILTL